MKGWYTLSDKLDNIIMKYKEVLSGETEFHEDNCKIQEILPYLVLLQNQKESFYGNSWRKYGDVSAFFNLARKFDRIDTIMRQAMQQGVDTMFEEDSQLSTETIFDTIADLALYGLMWSADIAKRYPELWEKFLKANELQCKSESDGI